MERYDPYNQSWCAISPALKYVSNFAATGCLGKLYLVGSCAVKYNALTLQCYNPVRGERLPQGHGSLGSDGEHVVPACLAAPCPFQRSCKELWGWGCFFFGGVEVQQQPSLWCARPAWCWLLLADLWSVITSPFIPKYLSAPRCATLHGLIYLIGDNTKKVHVYDPEANIWQKVPTGCSRGTAFTPRSDFRQFVLIFPAPPSMGCVGLLHAQPSAVLPLPPCLPSHGIPTLASA